MAVHFKKHTIIVRPHDASSAVWCSARSIQPSLSAWHTHVGPGPAARGTCPRPLSDGAPTQLAWAGAGDEKELVGLATTTPYTNSLYGFNLAVIPRLRGRGLGLRLMRQAQAEALEQGATTHEGYTRPLQGGLRRLIGVGSARTSARDSST
jgi:GNAT superfamily N-acetyltransferase